MIKVITFDLWDTVFIDDSDEKTRQAKGMNSKPVERRHIIRSFLEKTKAISQESVNTAYDTADAAFRHVWYQQGVTWTVRERLEIILKGLQRKVTENDLKEMVRLHEEMELEIMPELAPDIRQAIAELHQSYKLAVISDTIFSPGRVLKKILERYDLLKYFSAFAFSDEIGCAKPDPRVFESIGNQLNLPTESFIHIGDREEKDVAGPHAVGAKAVLTTVVKDRGSSNTKAEAICKDYSYLVELIDDISRG